MGWSQISTKRKFESTKHIFRKEEISQINNLNSHLKNLEKDQNEPKASWMKETKTRAEINEIEGEKQQKKSMK